MSEKIVIIGAGTMGTGIAKICLGKNIEVYLYDIKKTALEAAKQKIEHYFSQQVRRNNVSEKEKAAMLSKLFFNSELREIPKDVNIVIEAVSESKALKEQIFRKLDQYFGKNTIFASNTSSISINELSSFTKRPNKVLGLHFFNPPIMMNLVELIKGAETSDYTVSVIIDFCQKIEKVPIQVRDTPGFIVNRLLWQFLNEAYLLLEKKIAPKETIDQAIKLGLNHPLGPFELSDYIGLDILLDLGDNIASQLGEQYEPNQILRNLVEQKKLGRKTKEGFYTY